MTLDKNASIPGGNKELIAKLKWRGENTNTPDATTPTICRMAATALEAADARGRRLQDKIGSLTDERLAYERMCKVAQSCANDERQRAEAAESRADRLAAEVERMREALEEAVEFADPASGEDPHGLTPSGDAMVARWRAALTAPAPGGEKLGEDWREVKQHTQPRLADGYTGVRVSKPGYWLVSGPGPALSAPAPGGEKRDVSDDGPDEDDVLSCESCGKKFPSETMTGAGDCCYLCEACHAEWKKIFDACQHKWGPGYFEGDEGFSCENCGGFVREIPTSPRHGGE